MKRFACAFVLLLCLSPGARADLAPDQALALLAPPATPEQLRARLLAFAHDAETADRYGAGEAQYYVGLSFDHDGRRDSAIACYQRAVELRGAREELFALMDARMRRRTPDDLARVIERMGTERIAATAESDVAGALATGRLAWALLLSGRADSAATLFAGVEPILIRYPDWRYRIGRTYLVAGRPKQAITTLTPLVVTSRWQDEESTALIEQAADNVGAKDRLAPQIDRLIAARDRDKEIALAAWGAKRRRFAASDHFILGGASAAPAGKVRRPAVIVLVAPGDSLESYDSLTVALVRAGRAVMLLEPRGTGWSLAPSCPTPGSWVGRERAMASRVAADVHDAMFALAHLTPVDTTRYLLIGVGGSAPIAVAAAEDDRRVRALVLVSPAPGPAERAPMAAGLARLQLPAYYQTGLEDLNMSIDIVDPLYQAGDRADSRVMESNQPGRGAEQFRSDPEIATRILKWVNGVMPPRSATRSTPLPRRR